MRFSAAQLRDDGQLQMRQHAVLEIDLRAVGSVQKCAH